MACIGRDFNPGVKMDHWEAPLVIGLHVGIESVMELSLDLSVSVTGDIGPTSLKKVVVGGTKRERNKEKGGKLIY